MGLRVALVEDDAFMRLTFAAALKTEGMTVVFEASNATDAVVLAHKHSIDVAVLDLHLGAGPTGIDVAQAIRRKAPSVGIVFLTSFDDPRLLSANLPPLPGGAHYITKNSIADIESLTTVIYQAAMGKGKPQNASTQNALGKFTDTQIETLRLLSQGRSNAEIAKRRFVSEKSVELVISRMAKSLGLSPDSTRNQRVHMAKVYFRALGTPLVDQD
jgi:two-component system nitrate/nitrite response regulator NarL